MNSRMKQFVYIIIFLCSLIAPANNVAFASIAVKKPTKDINSILKELRKKRVEKFLKIKADSKVRKRAYPAKRNRFFSPLKNKSSISPKSIFPANYKQTENGFSHPNDDENLREFTSVDDRPYFDLPVTYNSKVKKWIKYFQGKGEHWFKKWLSRSHRYLPGVKKYFKAKGLPQDLAYLAMIESGFSSSAVSPASAVGYWQFIKPTANRYGLRTNWWLDERRNINKSTAAAAAYLSTLYKMFNSWYLTAAAYNMGEGRTQRLIKKYKTSNFWRLSKQKDFPRETREYIPKLIAAMLIAKAPKIYGFRKIKPLAPQSYEYFFVPGGADLVNIARYVGLKKHRLTQLNPELTKGFVPTFVKNHKIRIPKGYSSKISLYLRKKLKM